MQVELAQYAHLCTIMSNMHHRRAGYPFGTIVDFASDGAGCPLFCLSPLAIHTRNIMEDPRCSLVVQMPGWTGMANARVTIFGDVYQLPPEMHEAAREVLLPSQALLALPMPPPAHPPPPPFPPPPPPRLLPFFLTGMTQREPQVEPQLHLDLVWERFPMAVFAVAVSMEHKYQKGLATMLYVIL